MNASCRYAAYYRDNSYATEHAKVRDGLERAVKSDPGYSDAWACLAAIYLDEYRFNYNPRPDPLDRALDAARRAVALDPPANVRITRWRMCISTDRNSTHSSLRPNVPSRSIPTMRSPWLRWASDLHYAGDERGIALVKKGDEARSVPSDVVLLPDR